MSDIRPKLLKPKNSLMNLNTFETTHTKNCNFFCRTKRMEQNNRQWIELIITKKSYTLLFHNQHFPQTLTLPFCHGNIIFWLLNRNVTIIVRTLLLQIFESFCIWKNHFKLVKYCVMLHKTSHMVTLVPKEHVDYEWHLITLSILLGH